MSHIPEALSLVAAFLAPLPARRDPEPEPVRWPRAGWAAWAVVGLVVATALPVAVALDAYHAEDAFRVRCEASGGRIAVRLDAKHPYACAGG